MKATDLTQQEKIVALLALKNEPGRFYKPQELMDDQRLFVGYEATARISEVVDDYPTIIDAKREGKYRVVRFRFEKLRDPETLATLPKRMRGVLYVALNSARVPYAKYESAVEHVINPDGIRVARPYRKVVQHNQTTP